MKVIYRPSLNISLEFSEEKTGSDVIFSDNLFVQSFFTVQS